MNAKTSERGRKGFNGRYRDMLHSMQAAVFDDSDDDDDEEEEEYLGESSSFSTDDLPNEEVSEQLPLLNTVTSDTKQRRRPDVFPDSPTKDDILERLGSKRRHRSSSLPDLSSSPPEQTRRTRRRRSNQGKSGSNGVDLLHLDAPVRIAAMLYCFCYYYHLDPGMLFSAHTASSLQINSFLRAQILHVMDRIEDQMEAHAYEDLVPLEVKLALEDKVFGWTHFTSSFFGHVAFTFGSYAIVYEVVTFCLKEFYGFKGKDIPAFCEFLRTILALWAAISTYRMVRRRRHIWFRAPYGSKAYKKDEQRRMQTVKETDQSTSLGRYMQSIRHRRVLKRLRKAEILFAKKHSNTLKLQQQRQNASTATAATTGYSSATPEPSSSSSSEDEYDSSDGNNSITSASTGNTTITAASSTMKRSPSYLTKPTNCMESYAHDQILFPTINHMPYAHGAYFGAAPFLLSNPHWISILRHLMPDVYVEISRRVVHAPASKLIHWAENNPVVAAHAAAHELEYHDSKSAGGIPSMEWDVFLDPLLVHRVNIVLEERDKFLATNSMSEDDPNQSQRAQQILNFYKKELAQRSKTLVDKMLIAHGNSTQLMLEQTGYGKYYNYSRVKRTRRTLGGGIYARQWMAVFAEALKLGVGYTEEEERANEVAATKKKRSSRRKLSSLLDLAESECPEYSMVESVRLLEKLTKSEQPVGLVLDIKSRHVPKRVWSVVIDTLRHAGIRVEGIASFFMEEIRHVSEHCEQPVQELIFCHSAGDLQKGCADGTIREGDSVFFNAGSLIWGPSPEEVNRITNFDPNLVKAGYKIQPFGECRNDKGNNKAQDENEYSTIQMYKEQFKLRIGLYCQEFAIDEAAVTILARYANSHPDLYELGFAWGGINGVTIKGICPGRFTATDGLWNQRYIGELWNYNQFPVSPQQS
eukprot:scaffold1391_cov123-Cylindrotheca_fusiformis.AAC.5